MEILNTGYPVSSLQLSQKIVAGVHNLTGKNSALYRKTKVDNGVSVCLLNNQL
jgi:hypothetical protein